MPNEPGLDCTIRLTADFKAMAAKLKGPASKQFRSDVNAAIRKETKPIVDDLQAAVMAIDSKVAGGGVTRDSSGRFVHVAAARTGSSSGELARAQHAGSRKIEAKRSHGLRATIARAIQVKIRTTSGTPGVQIRVDTSKLPEGQRKLPAALNKAKFRHPVFGHEPWVDQTGSPGWWSKTVEHHHESVREAILRAMRELTSKL